MTTRAKNNITKPKKFHDDSPKHPLPHAFLVAGNLNEIEPTCYSQASTDANWRSAMNSEFDTSHQEQYMASCSSFGGTQFSWVQVGL
jgi:hypothetical protein